MYSCVRTLSISSNILILDTLTSRFPMHCLGNPSGSCIQEFQTDRIKSRIGKRRCSREAFWLHVKSSRRESLTLINCYAYRSVVLATLGILIAIALTPRFVCVVAIPGRILAQRASAGCIVLLERMHARRIYGQLMLVDLPSRRSLDACRLHRCCANRDEKRIIPPLPAPFQMPEERISACCRKARALPTASTRVISCARPAAIAEASTQPVP
jgi:hypothetical protein